MRKLLLLIVWLAVAGATGMYELWAGREMLRMRTERATAELAVAHLKCRLHTRHGDGYFTDGKYHIRIPVTVTAYAPTRRCTDDTPFETASGKRVRGGIVALSKDVERRYKFRFDEKLWLVHPTTGKGKEVTFTDRMNPRWRSRADVFMWSEKNCARFGKRKAQLVCERDLPRTEERGPQRY